MSETRTAPGWLRRQFAWSNTRQSWYERLGVLALTGGLALGWWLSRDWGLESRLLILGLWLVVLAFVLRRGLLKLFGPVFFFELLRGSRKRVHLTRTIYSLILLAALGYVHLVSSETNYRRQENSLQQQAETAATFFVVFFVIQMVVVTLVTPVMTAGAIAEEKERRTLEFMLATDLRNREIVMGKLAGRLAGMALILLAGLPILSILQFLGGIDPGLLLCALGATVLTQASVAALSIWQSVVLRRSRDAIVMTYLFMLGYLVFSGAIQALRGVPEFANESVRMLGWSIDGIDVLDGIGAGNPFVATVFIIEKMFREDGAVMEIVPGLLKQYAIFHVGVIGVCLAWAVARIRPLALLQSPGGESKRTRRGRVLPAIGRFPMLWKELFAEPGMRTNLLVKIVVALIVLASFIPPVWITVEALPRLLYSTPTYSFDPWEGSRKLASDFAWERYGEAMNAWLRTMAGVVGTILLLSVGTRAAGSVTSERGRQTLDELLTTPLSNATIINSKWLGSVLGVRRGLAWLGICFFIGLCSGGVNILGVVLFPIAWFSYACMMASIGVWFSASCQSSFRATLATIIVALVFLGVHWAFSGIFCYLPANLILNHSDFRDVENWTIPAQLGFTPPFVLGAAPVLSFEEVEDLNHEDTITAVFSGLGVVATFGMSQIMRVAAIRKFATTTGRTAIRHPEWSPEAPDPDALPQTGSSGESASSTPASQI